MKERKSSYIPIKERMGVPLILSRQVDGEVVIFFVVTNPSLDQQLAYNRKTLEIDRPNMIRDLLIRENPNSSQEDKEEARVRLVNAFRQAKIASAAIGIVKYENNQRVYQPSFEMRARWGIKKITREMGGTKDQARRFANMFPRHTKGVQRIEIQESRRREKELQNIQSARTPVCKVFLSTREGLQSTPS